MSVSVRLFAIPGSHPCASAAAMLDAKGLTYDRVDLVPALSRLWLRAAGFAKGTVPALRLDGVRVQGSRAIARALDAHTPEPPFFPTAPDRRAVVEEIEAWGDGHVQGVARRIALWAMARSGDGRRAALDGARLQLHLSHAVAARLSMPVVRLDALLNGARTASVRADVEALPSLLDRIDAWIAAGTLGGDPPTAADFQLAGSLRLLLTLDDLDAVLATRPAAQLARRVVAVFPGRIPAGTLPAEWLRGG